VQIVICLPVWMAGPKHQLNLVCSAFSQKTPSLESALLKEHSLRQVFGVSQTCISMYTSASAACKDPQSFGPASVVLCHALPEAAAQTCTVQLEIQSSVVHEVVLLKERSPRLVTCFVPGHVCNSSLGIVPSPAANLKRCSWPGLMGKQDLADRVHFSK